MGVTERSSASLVTRQKATGAYYTPKVISDFLAKVAIYKSGLVVLDPSCGDGVFLESACERLLALGSKPTDLPNLVTGIDSDSAAVARVRKSMESKYGANAPRVLEQNFFETDSKGATLDGTRIGKYDAVIGNPPYIRYHLFSGKQRELALASAMRGGVHLNRLSSAWAPFLVHACEALKRGGVLSMVLPGELLQVDYASRVRRYLLSRFERLDIIAFDKRVFPNALEDTMLVVGDTPFTSDLLRLFRLRDASELQPLTNLSPVSALPKVEVQRFEKWTPLLLPDDVRGVLARVARSPGFRPLGEVGRVDIGVVSGNNKLFIVNPTMISKYSIEREVLTPIVSGARQLSGIEFRSEDLEGLVSSDEPCYLIDAAKKSEGFTQTRAYHYLKRQGDAVRDSFKIRTRKQWYTVPATQIPDCFMTYMIGDVPHLVANTAHATSTNSVHRVFLASASPPARILAFSFYNSITLLSAELNGRSYGGGVLKLETKEAEKLLVPSNHLQPAESIISKVDELLRLGKFDSVIAIVDSEIVKAGLASTETMVDAKKAWQTLLGRRRSRMAKDASLG